MNVTAEAQVKTEKADRYLKALVNHFSHKVTAEYNANKGLVKFDFGSCQMEPSCYTSQPIMKKTSRVSSRSSPAI